MAFTPALHSPLGMLPPAHPRKMLFGSSHLPIRGVTLDPPAPQPAEVLVKAWTPLKFPCPPPGRLPSKRRQRAAQKPLWAAGDASSRARASPGKARAYLLLAVPVRHRPKGIQMEGVCRRACGVVLGAARRERAEKAAGDLPPRVPFLAPLLPGDRQCPVAGASPTGLQLLSFK